MAKRGETRPYRMSYEWLGTGIRGSETYVTEERATVAAWRQSCYVGGQSGMADCVARVTHRDAPDATIVEYRGADAPPADARAVTPNQLTATQAAARIGVSVRTLDRYVEAGRIVPLRTPGGHRRFDPADVDRLLHEPEA